MLLWFGLWILRPYYFLKSRKTAFKKDEWTYSNYRKERHQERMLRAANNGSAWQIRMLITKFDVDPNFVNRRGLTPLLLAIDGNHDAAIQTLMRLGALAEVITDPEVSRPWAPGQDHETKDPLERAIIRGCGVESVYAIAKSYGDAKHLEGRIFSILNRGRYSEGEYTGEIIRKLLLAKASSLHGHPGNYDAAIERTSSVHQ
jgi:hypothetical protein